MRRMLELLKAKDIKNIIRVNKDNYAVRMYQKVGLEIIGDGADETEYLMACKLND